MKHYNYTTPPDEMLTSTPENNTMIIDGATVAGFLTAANIPAKCVNVVAAPQVIRYDLNLDNIMQYNETKLKNVLKAFAARYNTTATLAQSTISDFAVEITRTERAIVHLKRGLYTESFNSATRSSCTIGVDTYNNNVVLDIANAPHVLIAGTTGSGKSVLLNSLICSLLYKITPATGQLLMIDPKQVELSIYEGLPHLFRPIVKGTQAAIQALAMANDEMDRRNAYMAKKRVKSLSEAPEMFTRLYIIIDELADLMLTSKRMVEDYIVRIAQLGRAAGIHLIIATQSPRANILTGLIKANIPCKIALSVSTSTESVVALGHGGAEKLTGRGDAIIKTSNSITERRFQSYLTPNEDIQRIVNYCLQQKPNRPFFGIFRKCG